MKKYQYILFALLSLCAFSHVNAQSLKEAIDKQNNNVIKTKDYQKILIEGVSFTMIYVKGGSFTMGADAIQGEAYDRDEKPTRKITLSDYYIGASEVTQELWETVMGTSISQQRDKANTHWNLRGEGDSYPMYFVSYDDIQEFILKLNEQTGMTFALPTEAQWEYAARGGNKATHKQFSGDETLDNVGWYNENASEAIHPVGQKLANELGIYDMSGNVWEWCSDWYSVDTYKEKTTTNPVGVESGEDIVLRGGSILTDEKSCRVSNRGHMNPSYRNSCTGFRLVLIP